MLSQFGKYVVFAIITAWIYLSNGGDTLFCVLFVMEYQFSVGTSFSLEIMTILLNIRLITFHLIDFMMNCE